MGQSLVEKLKWQVIVFLARRLPPCNAMIPMFSEALERHVTLRKRLTIRLHLFTCEACRRYVRQIGRMSEMVKPPSEEIHIADSAIKLSSDARARIQAALEAATQRRN